MYSQYSIKQVMLKAKLLLATRKQGVICYCCQNLMTKQSQRSNLPRSKRLKEKLCLELGFTRAGVLVFSSVSHVIHSRCSIFVEGWVNGEKWVDNPINILYITYICVVMWVMHYPSNCRWRLAPELANLGSKTLWSMESQVLLLPTRSLAAEIEGTMYSLALFPLAL